MSFVTRMHRQPFCKSSNTIECRRNHLKKQNKIRLKKRNIIIKYKIFQFKLNRTLCFWFGIKSVSS